MKILLINYRYFLSGGPERYMFNLIKHMQKKNHKIIPFSINYTQNHKTEYSKYFVSPLGKTNEVYFSQQKMTPKTIIKTVSRLFYSKEVERSVSRLCEDTQPQTAYVLHYLRKLSPALLAGLKKQNIPIIVRLSDYMMLCPQAHCILDSQPCTKCISGGLLNSIRYNCVQNSKISSILNALATWYHNTRGYFELIDNFVTTNPFMHKMMLEAGWPETRLTCIPTFTDINAFRPAQNYSKSNYICYAGRLDHSKGVHILIKAFIKMKQRIQNDVILKIAGKGSETYVNKLRTIIDSNNMSHCIQLTGHIETSDLSDFFGQSLFSVVPSIWFENLPNSILESYASGTPVIASDIGSLPGCIKKKQTGDLFKTGDVQDLSMKIEYYLNNREALTNMFKGARNEAVNNYSADSHLQSLERLFQAYCSNTVKQSTNCA